MKMSWPDAKRMTAMLAQNCETMWGELWVVLSAPLKESVKRALQEELELEALRVLLYLKHKGVDLSPVDCSNTIQVGEHRKSFEEWGAPGVRREWIGSPLPLGLSGRRNPKGRG